MAEHNLSTLIYPFLQFPHPQPAKPFPFYLQMPEQSCKCQSGQQTAVTAAGVWDRGSRWGKETQVSPPSWSSSGTAPHLYSGQPWSWKLVRGEETPSTSLLLLTSRMFCCGQSPVPRRPTNREVFHISTTWFQKPLACIEKKRSIRNLPPEKWAIG